MQSIADLRDQARLWYSPEPSAAQECAASVREKIAQIAALIEASQSEKLTLKPRHIRNPEGMSELHDALFVVSLLNRVLEAWPEYWNEEYMAEMAEED